MLTIFIAVAGWTNREKIALKIKSVYASVPPKASQALPPGKRGHSNVAGDAPWAMSALPECFTQESKTSGPSAYVLAHLPAGAAMMRPGETASFGDCSLQVSGDAILVTRGSDRLRIPPIARLYRAGTTLALLRGGGGGLELRIYDTAAPTH
ncbi:MAG TPA: hypothetical protein VFL13_00145 [Candidatus Baltobacteraceae bacterium]|nr:hypothetical protein [Candidatus Baltobacteraceae bacterium]